MLETNQTVLPAEETPSEVADTAPTETPQTEASGGVPAGSPQTEVTETITSTSGLGELVPPQPATEPSSLQAVPSGLSELDASLSLPGRPTLSFGSNIEPTTNSAQTGGNGGTPLSFGGAVEQTSQEPEASTSLLGSLFQRAKDAGSAVISSASSLLSFGGGETETGAEPGQQSTNTSIWGRALDFASSAAKSFSELPIVSAIADTALGRAATSVWNTGKNLLSQGAEAVTNLASNIFGKSGSGNYGTADYYPTGTTVTSESAFTSASIEAYDPTSFYSGASVSGASFYSPSQAYTGSTNYDSSTDRAILNSNKIIIDVSTIVSSAANPATLERALRMGDSAIARRLADVFGGAREDNLRRDLALGNANNLVHELDRNS